MPSSRNKLTELQALISKMPLSECCAFVLPEFGVRWREVSKVVRNSRMRMDMASVARVLCTCAKSLPEDDLAEILVRLRLRLVSISERTWHVIHLKEQTSEEPFDVLMRSLPRRILHVLRAAKKNVTVQVESLMVHELLYLSVQLLSAGKESPILYIATPPGQPIALVSSLNRNILKPCVKGLGFNDYEDPALHGKDIPSLLKISNPNWNRNADHLTQIPVYDPSPTFLPNGIDYTHKNYDLQYVDSILGPNPPLLTELTLKKTHNFQGTPVAFTMSLKTDDVAKSLKNWVDKGVLTPQSDLFRIFHDVKSNRIVCTGDSD